MSDPLLSDADFPANLDVVAALVGPAETLKTI